MGVERRSPHSRASHGTSGGKHLQYHDHELEIKLLEQGRLIEHDYPFITKDDYVNTYSRSHVSDSIAKDTILSEEFLQLELRGGLLQVVS